MAMFHLLKIRTSIDIFKNEKCKVTFGIEYIIEYICHKTISFFYRFKTSKWILRGLSKRQNTSPNNIHDLINSAETIIEMTSIELSEAEKEIELKKERSALKSSFTL